MVLLQMLHNLLRYLMPHPPYLPHPITWRLRLELLVGLRFTVNREP